MPADTSPAAEWASFVTQLNDAAVLRDSIKEPNQMEKDAVLYYLEKKYSCAMQVPVHSEWWSRSRFEQLLTTLDNSSSPGYPYMKEKPTIGDWLGADGFGKYNPVQVQRLWLDVQKVMDGTYEHYFRAFVKDEPHKIAKAETNRWRLVIASSLPVQMVWRMLYHEQNDALNRLSAEIPSKHGYVHCYGGWRKFLAEAKTLGMKISRDISGWDVGAPGFIFEIIRDLRESWAGVDEYWKVVHRRMYADAYGHSKILFSNGLVVEQLFPGYMKSGLFSTIADNSLAMVGIHGLACGRANLPVGEIWATGDDVTQSTVSDAYLDELGTLGCRVKEVLHHLEFMGINYSSGKPEPMYQSKHLYNVTMKGFVLEELFDSYCRMYAESEHFGAWAKLAKDLGVNVKSQRYYQFWYSSPLASIMSSWFV